jgi:hypothetical protein
MVLKVAQQNSVKREFHKIRRSFISLAKAFDRLGPALSVSMVRGTTNGHAPETRTGRRKPSLSAAQRSALKLQGRYMGTMRGLKATYQARVKAIRKTRGIKAAIAAAQKLAAR